MPKYREAFEDYTDIFKDRIADLKNAPKYPVTELFGLKKSEKTIIKELNIPHEDFKGLYVFWRDQDAVYVGISRKVIKRLSQHVKGVTHHSATFPIKILKNDFSGIYGKLPRNPN